MDTTIGVLKSKEMVAESPGIIKKNVTKPTFDNVPSVVPVNVFIARKPCPTPATRRTVAKSFFDVKTAKSF